MSPTLAQLDAQWPRIARSPEARRALIRWANDDRRFGGMNDLVDVVDARHDPAIAGSIERALAAIAPTDELAARTLLQMLLPGLVRLKATVGRTDADATHEFVVLAWERIRTYPTTRHGSVAANVVLDVRKNYVKMRLAAIDVAAGPVPEAASTDTSPEEHLLGVAVLDDLVGATRAGVVTPDALSTILRTRLGGEKIADIAAEQRVDAQMARQRRWRAERRLRALPLAA